MTNETGKDETRGGASGGDGAANGLPRKGGTLKLVAIAAAFALVGFGAVYVGGNGPGGATQTAPGRTVAAASPPDTATPSETEAQTEAQGDTVSGAPVAMAKLPDGPGSNPLSVGEMAMFVFKGPQSLPEFTFKNDAGADIALADWKGKVVLVNLWATWCAPCRKEMPDLDRLEAELGGADFEVVAISLDRGTDRKPREFLEEIGIKHLKLYHDPTARIGNKLQAIGLPATLLLDRDGNEIGRLVGPAKWDSPDALRLVRTAITTTRGPS